MNFVLHGHAVATGITIGYAHLVSTARLEVGHYEVPPEDVESEVERFDAALKSARSELEALKTQIPSSALSSTCTA
jgi:phosphotransferase system enzyme I (PtsI)